MTPEERAKLQEVARQNVSTRNVILAPDAVLRLLDALDAADSLLSAERRDADIIESELRAELAAMSERAERAERERDAARADLEAESQAARRLCEGLDAQIAELRATVETLSADARAVRDVAMRHAVGFTRPGETAAPAIERMASALRDATERAEKAERERDKAEKMLDVCSDVHAHNVKLHADREALRTRLAEVERERDGLRFDLDLCEKLAFKRGERLAALEASIPSHGAIETMCLYLDHEEDREMLRRLDAARANGGV